MELCAALTAFGLIALVVAPTLASTKTDGERVVCFNNLRMIGHAVNAYQADHGGKVSWRTLITDGGTMPTSGLKPGVAWSEFAFFSNNLATPKILACPADTGVRVARSFPEYRSVGFRENATSYTVGLDVATGNPRAWISGDRNLRASGFFGGCSARVNNAETILLNSQTTLTWTNAVHGTQGHLLLNDGSVSFTDTPTMRSLLLTNNIDFQDFFHFLKAQ